MMHRRTLLQSGLALALASSLSAGPMTVRADSPTPAAPSPGARRKVLVMVFIRGGMDGLMAVQPYTDARLTALRPKLVLPAPDSSESRKLIELSEGYGLHPGLAPLAPFYADGRLAIIHGVGNPYVTRSHFDAEQYCESGTPGLKGTATGWLARALIATRRPDESPFRAVSLTESTPRSLYGNYPALATLDPGEFSGTGAGGLAALQGTGLEALYADNRNALLRATGASNAAAAALLGKADYASLLSPLAAKYPRESGERATKESNFAGSMRRIAQLIRADVGLEVAFAESRGAWDTHSTAFAPNSFQFMSSDLSRTLATFWEDLGERQDDVTVIAMTEFGRTVQQNGSAGTDHGRASAMFVLGHQINGGKVYGRLPERFELDALEDQRDVPVTTDFRAVLSSVAGPVLGFDDRAGVFPGWSGAGLPLLQA